MTVFSSLNPEIGHGSATGIIRCSRLLSMLLRTPLSQTTLPQLLVAHSQVELCLLSEPLQDPASVIQLRQWPLMVILFHQQLQSQFLACNLHLYPMPAAQSLLQAPPRAQNPRHYFQRPLVVQPRRLPPIPPPKHQIMTSFGSDKGILAICSRRIRKSSRLKKDESAKTASNHTVSKWSF